MGAPQIIMIALLSYSFLDSVYEYGKTRNGQAFLTKVFASAITVGLLSWGGYWTN